VPELRKDPIVGRWVIIATERARRPLEFKAETPPLVRTAAFCPFCPGFEDKTPPEILAYRSGANPRRDSPGWTVRVVPNRFPALKIEGDLDRRGEGLYDKMNGVGAHEVIIETPEHDRAFADLEEPAVADVLWAIRERMVDLKKDMRFRYAMVFKNHGAAAGASLDHEHTQLIALPIVPITVAGEMAGARQYYDYKERCVFCDIIKQELTEGRRVIYDNTDFAVIAPFASRLPFETWILPKTHAASFEACGRHDVGQLANALRTALRKMNLALDAPPYNFMLHTSPFQQADALHYHWHIEIMPTLTKVAGFEQGSGFFINPTTPEDAAAFLRELVV
jgi:UDPglucose--hexose-1-phosphate uridylyltransferase